MPDMEEIVCGTCGHEEGWHLAGFFTSKRRCEVSGCKCKELTSGGGTVTHKRWW